MSRPVGCSDAARSCETCGAGLAPGTEIAGTADFDQAAERFHARYEIDVGDRTVDEYPRYVERVDHSLAAWLWLVVGVEAALVGLLAYAVVGPAGWELLPALLGLSTVLAAAIYADTALVGFLEPSSRTRWAYIDVALVPYCGQIAPASTSSSGNSPESRPSGSDAAASRPASTGSGAAGRGGTVVEEPSDASGTRCGRLRGARGIVSDRAGPVPVLADRLGSAGWEGGGRAHSACGRRPVWSTRTIGVDPAAVGVRSAAPPVG